jgi:hypothetical protein
VSGANSFWLHEFGLVLLEIILNFRIRNGNLRSNLILNPGFAADRFG